MPNISIVVPVYNSARFLEACLESLAAMAFEAFEVIAVDDGSEDDSWSIIERFARRDPRFSRSCRAPHAGLGPARNRGLDLAMGEFVAFVDSDDQVDPDYCGAPYALACAQGADVVMFGSRWIYPDRQEIHLPSCDTGMSPQEVLLNATPMVWEKLYRRAFLQRWNLRFPAIWHEDEVFTPVLMAHAPRIAILPRPLYIYNKREGSISGLRINANSRDVLQGFQMVIEQSRRLPSFRNELEFYAVRFLRWTASCWRSCGEAWAADSLHQAEGLLREIDHPESTNPYLLQERRKGDRRRRRQQGLMARLYRLLHLGEAHVRPIAPHDQDGDPPHSG